MAPFNKANDLVALVRILFCFQSQYTHSLTLIHNRSHSHTLTHALNDSFTHTHNHSDVCIGVFCVSTHYTNIVYGQKMV